MSKIIKILLKEREEILKRIEEVTAPYKEELQKADAALIILGHNFDGTHHQPTSKQALKNPTIKERVTRALAERYPNGAHYSGILEYINETWPHLPVKRTSLSPQLTRLRKKEVIFLDEDKGIWHLAKKSSAPEGAETSDDVTASSNVNQTPNSGSNQKGGVYGTYNPPD